MLSPFASPFKYGVNPECIQVSRELIDDVLLYTMEFQHPPDNRITPGLVGKAICPALDDIEREWRADRKGQLENGPGSGKAALITVGLRDTDRFYSNGLNLELAVRTEGFFNNAFHPLHARFLTYPIPTIAALNGHTFAGGMSLAMAQDFRVIKGGDGRARAMMCMNEIDFAAVIPTGMAATLKAKAPSPAILRNIFLGVRFAGSDALEAGLVDAVGRDANEVVKLSRDMAIKVASKAATGIWGRMKQEMYDNALVDCKRDMGNFMQTDDDEAEERLGPVRRTSNTVNVRTRSLIPFEGAVET